MMDRGRPLALGLSLTVLASLLPLPALAQQPGSPPPAAPPALAPPPVVVVPAPAPPPVIVVPPPAVVVPLPRPRPTTGQAIGATVVNVFRVPGKLLLCTLGTVTAGGLLILTFGTGHRVAGDVFEEGCGGQWVLGPADLDRDLEPGRAFDPHRR